MRLLHILPFLAAATETKAFHPLVVDLRMSTTILLANHFGMDSMGDLSEESKSASATLMARLNDQRASLARVVAAFPPDGHALDLNLIEDVKVLEVEKDRIQIQVTICERESCSAITVPITFLHPCASAAGGALDLEECALENLQDLNQQAELLLRQAEWERINFEYHAELKRQSNELLDPSTHIEFPEWWTLPRELMIPGCATLQQLLNGPEFSAKLCAMASSSLFIEQPVHQAAIYAIGPAGILFRARISSGDVVETSMPFHKAATTVDELRNNVMSAIDSAVA